MRTGASIIIFCSISVISASTLVINSLPPCLLTPPAPLDPSSTRLHGTIMPSAANGPRAVLGYVSDKDWAILEFVAMTHASWMYLTNPPMTTALSGGLRKLDIWAFSHPRWAKEMSQICTVIDLDSDLSSSIRPGESQCFVILYPIPPEEIWHGYPFINNVHFFADERVAQALTSYYSLIMKSDFDTFLTPGFVSHVPEQLTFGIQEYAILKETGSRLVRVADYLGLNHNGRHNLGPTWLGPPSTVISMANMTIPVLHHIITREFEQLPGGGLVQKWYQGEGFPLWSAGMAAMYATEIVANHFLDGFISTFMMDMHADSLLSTQEVLHIHCRHGDGDFSKFEFFRHHYDNVDLSKLNIRVVRDYAMLLATSTWRGIGKGKYDAKKGRDEL